MKRPKSRKVAPTDRITVAYVRVSTDDQAMTGVSLDDQEGRLRAYSAAMGWDAPEVVVDAGESAKTLQRPGMTTLLDRVRRGEIARVVIAKLDRLTRSTRDLADLLEMFAKHDVALVSLAETLDTSSAAGRMLTSLLGVIGQWEREACGERTASALGHKRRQRQVYGSTPFGYRREDDRLVEEPADQAALAEAVRLDRAGASFREIGRMLTERGAKPRRAAVWHASSVRAVLRSKATTEAIPA